MSRFVLGVTLVFAAGAALAIACRPPAPAPPRVQPPPDETRGRGVRVAPDTEPRAPQRSSRALGAAARDSLLQEVRSRRAQWQARHITHYRIRVAVQCFCPWPHNPGVLEVRDGTPVALHDTTGKSLGAPREPWSLYTVERLFDFIERGASTYDVLQVTYDSSFGYATSVGGDAKVGQFDDWFSVTAGHLVPLR